MVRKSRPFTLPGLPCPQYSLAITDNKPLVFTSMWAWPWPSRKTLWAVSKSRGDLGIGWLPQVVIGSRNQLAYRHGFGEMEISTGLQGPLFVFGTAPG